MYDENNLIYILTILESIEKIKIYSNKFDDADDFLWGNEQLNFNGSVNLLIAIGEESKKIDAKLKEEFDMDWKAIAGIRDKMSHDYRGIDPHIVWNVIQTKLDDLRQTMIRMIERIDYDKETLTEALKTNYYSHLSYLA